MHATWWKVVSGVLAGAVLAGCGRKQGPADRLVVISPHNRNIEQEFGEAFKQWYKGATSRDLAIEWRDVGGGSSTILEYLRNVYRRAETSKIDVVFGGGEDNFMKMAAEGILQPMKLPEEVTAQIPATFGGQEMYDPGGCWCGAAVSGFGFLYNATLLKRLKLEPPRQWEDLADGRFHDLVALADPMQSGSAAAAYEMIVQSGKDWPGGWAKLLGILGNAKKFYNGASQAADAVVSEAPVATCIDFYGVVRATKYPDELVYVSPRGQTAFSPDPIGILKNPPSGAIAGMFVEFVLSKRGQGLWGLKVGAPDGPVKHALFRQPIRRDVYEAYAGHFLPGVVNPYEAGNEMKLDVEMRKVRFGVLRNLVRAAAIDCADGLKKAKKKLIETRSDPARLAAFEALPPDVATREQIAEVAAKLKDSTLRDRIVTGWQRFFRGKYAEVAK